MCSACSAAPSGHSVRQTENLDEVAGVGMRTRGAMGHHDRATPDAMRQTPVACHVARDWCLAHGIRRGTIVMTHGPSRAHPDASNFVEIFSLTDAVP